LETPTMWPLYSPLAGCGKTGDFSEIRNPHYAEFKMGRV
jgi:hypothetical protein